MARRRHSWLLFGEVSRVPQPHRMRVLFVAGEVAPFSEIAETARLMRVLPEALQEQRDVEPRIMMPRYGVVSERRNRLHEVIRLSGDVIQAGTETETLKVKVASIPGIRLQVYFMDAVHFFKRKGVHLNKRDGKLFEDNPARALFYARAALATARKLGWDPDVVHAAGWMAAFVPHVLRTEPDAGDPLAGARLVYTPDTVEGYTPALTAEDAEALGLPAEWAGQTLRQIGLSTADAAIYADDDAAQGDEPKGPSLAAEPESADAAADLYGGLAPAAAA